ncbi:MAG: hypothetical protein L0215_23290 [Gemmataceae bacterium]|nr:hypothetical protein [Gemmataceae bacterium]
MTTITILPESPGAANGGYRAVAGKYQSAGGTVGQALDALSAKLNDATGTTLVVVQHDRPDAFFTGEQRKRLEELMTRWRSARDTQQTFPAQEQAELDALVELEVQAAAQRTTALLRE